MSWCRTALTNAGFRAQVLDDPSVNCLPSDLNADVPQHRAMYLYLRQALMLTGGGLTLPLSEKPQEPYDWLQTHNQEPCPEADLEARDNDYQEDELVY